MKYRLRHLWHALAAGFLVAAAGWLLAQPWVTSGMSRSSGERDAGRAVIVTLTLFALVSAFLAVRGARPEAKRKGGVFSYASPSKRR